MTVKPLFQITPTQRELLELLAASPRGYVTKTKEGTEDMMALDMMGMVHDVYEMGGGGFVGSISKAGRDALAAGKTCNECGEHIGHCECHVTPA